MPRALAAVIMVLVALLAPPSPLSAAQLTLFSTEQQAQQHCPRDTVVWLNLPSGIYHFRGERWYGQRKNRMSSFFSFSPLACRGIGVTCPRLLSARTVCRPDPRCGYCLS